MMEIEVLLSTMNQDKDSMKQLLKKMNIQGKVLAINQITNKEMKEINYLEGKERVYSYRERGLVKSRNKAIENMQGDIGIFSDDDIIYNENYIKTIEEAYNKYPNADVIVFDVISTNKNRQIKKQHNHKLNILKLLRVQSVQITFKKESIIKLDEDFGIGAKYKFGEENILLSDLKCKKKNIYYVDKNIGIVTHKNSTWYFKMDAEFLKCEGAVFYRISKKWYKLLALQYAFRKRKEYKENLNMRQALRCLLQGAEEYKNK